MHPALAGSSWGWGSRRQLRLTKTETDRAHAVGDDGGLPGAQAAGVGNPVECRHEGQHQGEAAAGAASSAQVKRVSHAWSGTRKAGAPMVGGHGRRADARTAGLSSRQG